MATKAQRKAKNKRDLKAKRSSHKTVKQEVSLGHGNKFPQELAVLNDALLRHGLQNPAQAIQSELAPETIKSPLELVQGVKRNLAELFKVFSYIASAKVITKSNDVDWVPECDMDLIGITLHELDKRTQMLDNILETDVETVMVEMLDMGAEMDSISSDLLKELDRATPHTKLIDGVIRSSAAQLIETEEEAKGFTLEQAVNLTLESVAYTAIHEAKLRKEENKDI